MAERDEATVRAKLYTKLYFVPAEVRDKMTIKQLKDMIKNTSCEICGKSFRAPFGKQIHILEIHMTEPPPTTGDSDSNSD